MPPGKLKARAAALGLAAVLACRSDNFEPPVQDMPNRPRFSIVTVNDTLYPVADAWVRSAPKWQENGLADTLRVKVVTTNTDTNRTVIRFDQAAIVAQVGAGTLVSAKLEMTAKASSFFTGGHDVGVYRMTMPWAEPSATWKCGDDLNTEDMYHSCPTTAWAMSGAGSVPFVSTATDTVHMNSGQSGVVRFDVTADVAAFLSGTTNRGWLLKATSETRDQRVTFWSREATAKPRLVLVTNADTSRPALPNEIDWPAAPLVVTSSLNPSFQYHRNLFSVSFDPETPGATIRAFLARYAASVIGGWAHETTTPMYLVQVSNVPATYAGVDSLGDDMRIQLGVQAVVVMAHGDDPRLRNRYPVDSGVIEKRSDWFNSAHLYATPFRAVRAPLAWGCETGRYGGPRIRVGVIDGLFDALPADLSSLSPSVSLPSAARVTPSEAHFRAAKDHGIGVAGILTARGENGKGMAGMIWDTDLTLYAFGRDTMIAANGLVRLSEILSDAKARNLRILNYSGTLGDQTQVDHVDIVKEMLKSYLGSGSDRLIVHAIGDNRITRTISQLATTTDTTLGALDRALAQLYQDAAYKNKILYVAGTEPSSGLRSDSTNIWSDADAIAAPAEGIATLSTHQNAYKDVYFGFHGTSYAAAFVSGVAAQLWTMNSTLTAAQVKEHILEGAKEYRFNRETGDSAPPANIGVSGVYQLDAYGALSRLSRSRAGTPICGLVVRPRIATTLARTSYVTLGRDVPDSIPVVAYGRFDGAVSVAQGGRLFSVSDLADTTTDTDGIVREYGLDQSRQWSVVRTSYNIGSRSYLELGVVDKTTVYADLFETPATYTLRDETGLPYLTTNLRDLRPASNAPMTGVMWANFSPDGTSVIFATWELDDPCIGKLWFAKLPNGVAQQILGRTCNSSTYTFGGDAVWDPSGERFVVSEFVSASNEPYPSRMKAWKIVNGVAVQDGTPLSISDRWPAGIVFTNASDSRVMDAAGTSALWLEYDFSTGRCIFARRAVSGSFSIISERFVPDAYTSHPECLREIQARRGPPPTAKPLRIPRSQLGKP